VAKKVFSMAQDRRLKFTPWQALRTIVLMPPMAIYLLIKTAILHLIIRNRPLPSGDGLPPDQWDVVCLSHVNWRHVWQRNQHTMSHLARRSRVLYINAIRLDSYAKHSRFNKLRCKEVAPNVWHYETFVFPFETLSPFFQRLNLWMLETRIRYQLWRRGFGPVVLWFYFPSQRWLVGRLNERAVVYDIQDEYHLFLWAPRDTADRERRLLEHDADIVFAGTDALYERKRPLARGETYFFGCGVDFDHFHNTYFREPRRDLHKLKNKIQLGYFGMIDERIDRDLLMYLSRQRPDWDLVMVGPILLAAFEPFEAPNVVFTRQKQYQELPYYLSLWNVCLMPFVMSELTRHINPTKALEYFASGKPVVSTPIPDMVKYYSDVIYFAETKEEFLARCEEAISHFPPERRERGLQLARERSWATVAAEMRKLITEVIEKKQKPQRSTRV
jgi:glycosyltransferase involved in cell wall biosynthesis